MLLSGTDFFFFFDVIGSYVRVTLLLVCVFLVGFKFISIKVEILSAVLFGW